MLNSIHPPRPDWYEELYASALDMGMKSYEAQVSPISVMRSWSTSIECAVSSSYCNFKHLPL